MCVMTAGVSASVQLAVDLLAADAQICSQASAAAAGQPARPEDIVRTMAAHHSTCCLICMLSVRMCRNLQLLLANPSAQMTALLAKAGVDKHHRCGAQIKVIENYIRVSTNEHPCHASATC